LAGHADRSGGDAYNMGLSERRAAAVRSYLTGKGVPMEVMSSEAFGESRPMVETADGVREPQNRRVEINFATPSNAPVSTTNTPFTGNDMTSPPAYSPSGDGTTPMTQDNMYMQPGNTMTPNTGTTTTPSTDDMTVPPATDTQNPTP